MNDQEIAEMEEHFKDMPVEEPEWLTPRQSVPSIPRATIEQAYEAMAVVANYRPAMADIDGPLEVLKQGFTGEVERYVNHWWAEEDEQLFDLGCFDGSTRAAAIYAVEGARCLAGMENDLALELLKMAVKFLEQIQPSHSGIPSWGWNNKA